MKAAMRSQLDYEAEALRLVEDASQAGPSDYSTFALQQALIAATLENARAQRQMVTAVEELQRQIRDSLR